MKTPAGDKSDKDYTSFRYTLSMTYSLEFSSFLLKCSRHFFTLNVDISRLTIVLEFKIIATVVMIRLVLVSLN